MNGALHANGSSVSTPVGSTTKATAGGKDDFDLAGRQVRFLPGAEQSLLPDFGERVSRKLLRLRSSQEKGFICFRQEPSTRFRHRAGTQAPPVNICSPFKSDECS